MTLSFSQKFPSGDKTLFTNKIVKGLWSSNSDEMNYFALNSPEPPKDCFNGLSVYESEQIFPKIHTIRRDKKNRWKVGNKIHFVINNRTQKRFQFAPILNVTKIEKFEIIQGKGGALTDIFINDSLFWAIDKRFVVHSFTDYKIEDFVKNDGFESVEKFLDWFSEDFRGKIIHWTGFSYSAVSAVSDA